MKNKFPLIVLISLIPMGIGFFTQPSTLSWILVWVSLVLLLAPVAFTFTRKDFPPPTLAIVLYCGLGLWSLSWNPQPFWVGAFEAFLLLFGFTALGIGLISTMGD